MRRCWVLGLGCLLLGCGDDDDAVQADGATVADAAAADARGPDAAPTIPTLAEVTCPVGTQPTTPPNFGNMRRVLLTGDARCNDGTPAVMFVRAADNPAGANRWVFFLQGGGHCEGYDDCMARWCGIRGENAALMSSRWEPGFIPGTGVFQNNPAAGNPFAGVNQVIFHYCSSDGWTGQTSDVLFTSPTDPSRRVTMHRRGHTILEAGLVMLRSGSGIGLDDLDNATEVMLTGSSAGAVGVRSNLDWLRAQFGASVKVTGMLDSGLFPDPTLFADPRVRTNLEAKWRDQYANSATEFYDESCLAMHAADGWRCADPLHVAMNHITTPFFQREDLRDPTLRANYLRLIAPATTTPDEFATASLASLMAQAGIRTTAEEAAQITSAPAVFGPNCAHHIVLTSEVWFTGQTLADSGGTQRSLRDLMETWAGGGTVNLIDQLTIPASVCPAQP